MIKTYLKIAFRNIMRYKVFSFINVIGLTIGLSASFIIGLMVYHDFTFDNFHQDGDRIYRVVTNFESPSGKFYNSGVTLALEDEVKDNSNFETVSGFYVERPFKVENKNENITVKWPDHVIFTDKNYFDIFQYNFLAGSTGDLSQPNNVILTQDRAARYFPNTAPQDIVGQTLVYNDSLNIKVTGVVENFKQRTDLVFEEFVSKSTLLNTRIREEVLEKSWGSTNSNSQLFVKLNESANIENIQAQFDAIAYEHWDEESREYQQTRQFALQPLNDIHFNPDYDLYDWQEARASRSLLQNLMLVAAFLLLLGCINFINLNTATATQRSKEIGIRKTLGSSRKQLVAQFLGETFLLVCFSAALSLVLSKFLLNVFSEFTPAGLSLNLLKTPIMIGFILILLVVVTFLSGYYPAMVLSKFNVVSVLKNNLSVGKDKVKLRKFLTFFQFTIAQVFIIATLLVGKQINFMLNQDMGFKTEAVLSVYSPRNERALEKKERLVQKLKTIPEVKELSLGGHAPASYSSNTTTTTYTDGVKKVQVELQQLFGDTNYTNLFEIELLAGRERLNDTIQEIIINETARKAYGFATPQEAVGKTINFDEDAIPIAGVMADFNQRSLKSEIRPMAILGDWYRSSFSFFHATHVSLKELESSDLSGVLSKIESAYGEVYTEVEDYRVRFMDETVATFYNREKRVSTLLNWATGLSILISCLGLLGLVIYTTNRRVKEIGVRKVLGASLFQINSLLCKEFLAIVGVAFVVASPIAWYGIYNWLQDFAYKTSISFWVFLASGFAMILFAVLIISAKTLQVAKTDPVNSLRTE